MVYVDSIQRCLLFGGQDLPTRWNDIWTWDGTNWSSPPVTGTVPTGRNSFGLAYDKLRDRVVLFGGETNTGTSSETWELDPQAMTWTLRTPTSPPSPRCCLGLTYDEKRGHCVLFGGRDLVTQTSFSDTWIWNGAAWTQQSPAVIPPGRDRMQLAYDAARERVVVFGGRDSLLGVNYQDTWEWNGADWLQRTPTTNPPPARFSGAMCFLPSTSVHAAHVLLFGGTSSNPGISTWTYEPLYPARVLPLGPGCPHASGIATLNVLGLPWIGDPITFAWTGAPPLAWTPLVLDAGLPLPGVYFSLWCSPTCLLWVNNTVVLSFFASFGGNFQHQVSLPAAPSLIGLSLHGQVAILTIPACLAFSNAVSCVIGSR